MKHSRNTHTTQGQDGDANVNTYEPRTELTKPRKGGKNGTKVSKEQREYYAGTQRVVEREVMYRITQADKISKLNFAKMEEDFASNRAMSQYIVVNVRLDISAPLQLIASRNGSTPKSDMKLLEKVKKFL